MFNDRQQAVFALSYLRSAGILTLAANGLDHASSIIESGARFDAVIIENEEGLDVASVVSGFAGLRVVLLANRRVDKKGIVDPNLTIVDSDPLSRVSLLKGIALATGRMKPDTPSSAASSGANKKTAPTVDEAMSRGELVLVAEDNLTNQDVIRRQLNVLGYACEISSDGARALEAWKTGRYALILTDCNMPNMDGYQLTAAVREAEKNAGARTPIVAITANVLQGEDDRCREAGMDGYLVKPLELDKLKATMESWISPNNNVEEEPKHEVQPIDTQTEVVESNAIDPRALKDMFGDDDEMFKEILGDFVEPSLDIIEEINTGYSEHDARAIGSASHKLKSSSRAVGAYALADLCAELEKVGKGEDWPAIEEAYPKLAGIMAEVTQYIKAL